MKTDKGFTLVELLAVIVILGIILAITIPGIGDIIKSSTVSSFKSDAKLVLQQIEYEKLKNVSFDVTTINKDTIGDVLGLPSENYTSISVVTENNIPIISIVGKGKWSGYIACGTYMNMKIVQSTNDCSSDLIWPVITILGDNPANIFIGDTYRDAGSTALDDKDGDITSRITVTGNVNPNMPGTYYITYTASDLAGNEITARRTVNVIDNSKPTVTFTPSEDLTYAQNRSVVVDVFDIGGADVSSLKYVWSLNSTEPDLALFTSNFVSGESISTSSMLTGSYYLWVTAMDISGNKTTTSSGIFNLDNEKPVITLNGNAIVTVNKDSVYTDLGAIVTDNISAGLTPTVSDDVNSSIVGTYNVTYNAVDEAGNIADSVTRTVNVIDNIAPSVAFGTNGNAAYAKNRSTTVTVSDNVSLDITSLKYLWNTSTTAPTDTSFVLSFTNDGTVNSPVGVTGGYYLWIFAKDTSGNTAVLRSNVFNLDNEKPIITLNGNATVTINKDSVYTDLGAIVTDNISTGLTPTVSSNVNPSIVGTYNVTYNASDGAGNLADAVMRIVQVVDVSAPVITMLGTNPTNINVNSVYSDAGATALDDVDGNVTNKIIITGTVNPSIVGAYTVTYTVSDAAGNTATSTRTVNVIDNVIPSVTFGANGNATYAKMRSTTVTVSDNVAVNTSSLKYQWTTSMTAPTEGTFTTSFTNGGLLSTPVGVTGGYYLWILAKDTNGNTMISRSNVFNLDNVIPVITLLGTTPVSVNVGTSYTDAGATATDNISTGLTPTPTNAVNVNVVGTYTVTYNVTDEAGNAATPITRTVNVIDNVIPTVAFGTNGNATYAKTRSTTVTVSDNVAVNTSSLKYQWTTSTTAPTEGSFSTTFTNGGTISSSAGVTGGYYLWILAKDTNGNTMISSSNIFNLDNTPPTLTVTGSNPITIGLNSTYTDAGATATDAHSGINGSVSTTGTVNPTIEGTYTITYNVADNAGNTATTTRTVNVIALVYTFTTAGATGSTGPIQTQLNSTYAGTSLAGKVTSSSGIQLWTVPYTGNYRIEVDGAQGGYANYNGLHTGGLGAQMIGTFALTSGQQLKILVGQKGTDMTGVGGAGGGGGTFVALSNNTSLIIAGGGGGGGMATGNGLPGNTSTSGTNSGWGGNGGAGPTGGGGGNKTNGTCAGGGAGFSSNGADGVTASCDYLPVAGGGVSFINGGTGGSGSLPGGFGGGGGAGTANYAGSGGGGGYGGGGGGGGSSTGTNAQYGGGGGSYNSGTSQSNTAGINASNGKVIITILP